MRFLKTAALIGLVSAAVVVLALEPAAGAGTEANVADCPTAIIGSGKATWRPESVVAGPVGVNREAMLTMSRTRSGDLVSKMPLLVEGEEPVTISVPRALRKRLFLYYGHVRSFATSRGSGETEFRPCGSKPRTVWAGGVRVKGTAPVHLLVGLGGGEPLVLHLGRPQVYDPER